MSFWSIGAGPRVRTESLGLLEAVRTTLEQQRGVVGSAPATVVREAGPATKARLQLLRYELFANSGRFHDRVRDVPRILAERGYADPHPFKWLVVPVEAGRVQCTGAEHDPVAEALLGRLITTVPTAQGEQTVALIPLHWQEYETLKKQLPGLMVIDDGKMFQTASPRSVLFGAEPETLPRLVPGLENFSVKMHLSEATYARMGGFDGSRVLNKNDCLMASVFSQVTRALARNIPRLQVLGEDVTIATTVPGDDGLEIGAIIRELPSEAAVPGFALFSPTKERLPHVKELPGTLRAFFDPGEARVPAADALRFLRQKRPGLSKEDAFVELLGEPILDVVFGLYAQGATLELHPQNFLLSFDAETGGVKKVVVRDLHGINYSAAWRAERGQPDLCSVEALRPHFPEITQADLDGWFKRPNPRTGALELRDRYQVPGIFGRNFDVYISVFFYQSLVALEECGYLSRPEVERSMIKLRDAVEAAAARHGFDLAQLHPGGARSFSPTMKVAFNSGMRGRALFRRPTDPQARAEFIATHERPVLEP